MLLDTDVLIDLLRKHPPAEAWFSGVSPLPDVAGFAAMELVNGCRDGNELRRVQRFLATFSILWPSDEDLSKALNDYLPLRLSTGIGLMDAVIAATAVGHNLPLATFNGRHFTAVPGLATVEPYTR